MYLVALAHRFPMQVLPTFTWSRDDGVHWELFVAAMDRRPKAGWKSLIERRLWGDDFVALQKNPLHLPALI